MREFRGLCGHGDGHTDGEVKRQDGYMWRNKLDDALNRDKSITKDLVEDIWNALKNIYPKK
jgi:hypothetical protein